jgi:uncharacterized small protein (DUF1192 family)
LDDDEFVPRAAPGLPRPLEALSVADLEAYREALEREIERVRAELARRQSVRGAAEALFRPPSGERR